MFSWTVALHIEIVLSADSCYLGKKILRMVLLIGTVLKGCVLA